MNILTLLGTGTCQIEYEHRASSVLLMLDDTPVLFDCGHGTVQRLLEAGVQHNQVNHVIFSHFHPDHVSDIIPLMQAGAWSKRNPRTTDLHLYGPADLQKVINGLFEVFGEKSFVQPGYQIHIHEVKEDQFTVGSHVFESFSLPPAGNRGIRFTSQGKRYALTGDSYFHEQEVAFLQDVDLAVIDAGHISDEEIVQLAVSSQVGMLVCSHLYRELDAAQLQRQAAQRGYRGSIVIGRDLLSFLI